MAPTITGVLYPDKDNSAEPAEGGKKNAGLVRSVSYEIDHENGRPLVAARSIISMVSLTINRDSEFKRGALSGQSNCWSEPNAREFNVRGPTYLKDGVKRPSDEALFTLVDVDIFRNLTPGRCTYFAETPSSYTQWALAAGETRFMVIVHFQSMTFNMVTTWVVDDQRMEEAPERLRTMWQRFLEDDDAYRNRHFKVIPRVVEANWLVKKAFGMTRPILFATKISHEYNVTDKYIEIMCDTTTSKVASNVTDLSISYANSLTLDMAILLEAKEESCLPERILGVFRMAKPELKRARKMPLPNVDVVARRKHDAS